MPESWSTCAPGRLSPAGPACHDESVGDRLEVSILGPLHLAVSGRSVRLGGPRQRAVVAALAIRGGRIVPAAVVVEDVWGPDASDGALHSLQQHLSELRKALDAPGLLQTHEAGYQLAVDSLDADLFEAAARAGAVAASSGAHDEAVRRWDEALQCWRGDVLADVAPTDAIRATATRLAELRATVEEDRIDSLLSLGRAREVVALVEPLILQHPYRERLRGQQMLALYRSGRQRDALDAFGRARATLVEGLGIEPSPELREMEQLILQQSDRLEDRGPSVMSVTPTATFRPEGGPVASLALPDGQVLVLAEGTTVVGRDPAAGVRLVDSRVSRRHAEIVTMGGESMVVDLGSTNGTFVNGEPVDRAVLVDGDDLSIGGVGLQFHDDR